MTASPATNAQPGRQSIQVVQFPAALGAEVPGFDLRQLDSTNFPAIHQAWLHNLLLVFRNQSLDAPTQVEVVRHFGVPVSSARFHTWSNAEHAAHELFRLPPEISVISNVKEKGTPIGALGDGEVAWHSDFSFKERPTAARMLNALEIPGPGEGGSTAFLNTHAAYDSLPAAMKRRIAGLTIKQDNTYDTAGKLRAGAVPSDDVRETQGPSHPIISTHPETGANCLFLGRRHGAYVNGLEVAESEALLDELWAHCTQPRFIYTHEWAVGDVVIWDNRCVLHRRGAFNPERRRVLYAVQVEGHRPVEASDALDRPAHPRYRVSSEH